MSPPLDDLQEEVNVEARVPDHLDELIKTIEYKPKWTFSLVETYDDDGSGGLQLCIVSHTLDSFQFGRDIRVAHHFLVPNTS